MALAHRTSRSPRRRTSMIVPRERESGVRLRSDAPAASPEDLRAFAAAAEAAALGLSVCARRARARDVAEEAASLAATTLADAARVKDLVPGGMRRPSTSERLRWEWLASTASLLDGGAERRLAEEIGRHLAIAADVAARLDGEQPAVADAAERLRSAASFCRSLAQGADPLRARPAAALGRL